MLKEFKEFIARGNVVDLAVGIIMGAAFTGIVNSLVNDLVMPPVGYLMGGIDFSDFFLTVSHGHYDTLKDAKAANATTVNYGVFINHIINFLIVALAVFVMVRAVHRLRMRHEQDTPAAPTTSEKLLTEIRDLLKQPRT